MNTWMCMNVTCFTKGKRPNNLVEEINMLQSCTQEKTRQNYHSYRFLIARELLHPLLGYTPSPSNYIYIYFSPTKDILIAQIIELWGSFTNIKYLALQIHFRPRIVKQCYALLALCNEHKTSNSIGISMAGHFCHHFHWNTHKEIQCRKERCYKSSTLLLTC